MWFFVKFESLIFFVISSTDYLKRFFLSLLIIYPDSVKENWKAYTNLMGPVCDICSVTVKIAKSAET